MIIFHIYSKTSFKVNFSLKCFQRLFITNVATRQWHNLVSIDTQWIRFSRSSRTKVYSFWFSYSRKIGTKLFHNVLNSDHVPPSLANSQTLGTTYSPRMRWSNIEVPNHPVDRVSREWLACYPWRTFYSLSDDLFHSESPDHYNRLSSLFDLSILQSSKYFYYYALKLITFNSNSPLYASVTF